MTYGILVTSKARPARAGVALTCSAAAGGVRAAWPPHHRVLQDTQNVRTGAGIHAGDTEGHRTSPGQHHLRLPSRLQPRGMSSLPPSPCNMLSQYTVGQRVIFLSSTFFVFTAPLTRIG